MRYPLLLIKTAHTAIWVVLASAVLYTVYSGLFNAITLYTWVAIGLIVLEGMVLLLNRWACPLTDMARKYSNSAKDNFDIYLPNWLARHNKLIFTTLFLIGLIAVLLRTLWPV